MNRPLTIANTEKDAIIRELLNACLECHDLLVGGWIERSAINLVLKELEPAIQSGLIKSADWPSKYRYEPK